jgi:transcriptional regulator with PAS, ATPase and Fis domain
VLETGEFEPVGSNATKHCPARILAASNIDLQEAVAEGQFRQDLYYRLNVLSVYLPPLRERAADVRTLAWGLAGHFGSKFQKEVCRIHPDVLQALEGFAWPGNIRQLANVIQQMVLRSRGPELLPQHLPPLLPPRGSPSPAATGPLRQQREDQERSAIAPGTGIAICRAG